MAGRRVRTTRVTSHALPRRYKCQSSNVSKAATRQQRIAMHVRAEDFQTATIEQRIVARQKHNGLKVFGAGTNRLIRSQTASPALSTNHLAVANKRWKAERCRSVPPARSIPVIVRRGANAQPTTSWRRLSEVAGVMVTANTCNHWANELTISTVAFLSVMRQIHITQDRKNATAFLRHFKDCNAG